MSSYHDPVLLYDSVKALVQNPDGVYVDATFGGGGHSREILGQLSGKGRLFAFDQDEDALSNELNDTRFQLINANFKDVKQYLKFYKEEKVDGVLADFGVSSHQFDSNQRGFSIRFEGPLDMRMNQGSSLTAEEVVNEYSEKELCRILKEYGEVKNANRLVAKIVDSREEKKIKTTADLIAVLRPLLPERFLNKVLAQVFQAIRIEVNKELKILKLFLEEATDLLKEKGRLVCISYHSLEDRLVKRYIREGVFEGEAFQDFYGNRNTPLRKIGKMIIPSEEEIKKNNRARSAKLRIAEKK